MKHPLRTLLLAVCCGLAAACTQRQERLKLMSYNIRNGIGIDNIQDIGRIARVILREAPDLVALQELDSATLRVDGRYIPGELGRMTGMHATFGRAIGFAGGSYGIGLLSRTEPLAVRSIPLPGREEARVLLMAEFPDYTVCITHLSLTPAKPMARPNVECMPVIRPSSPSDNPAVRIDYILGRGLPTSATVAESAVDHTATASDHCPLWVTLVWKRGKQPGK